MYTSASSTETARGSARARGGGVQSALRFQDYTELSYQSTINIIILAYVVCLVLCNIGDTIILSANKYQKI